MAKDLQDHVRDVVKQATRGAAKSAPLPGAKGMAAGVGALALAPLAVKGIGKLAHNGGLDGVAEAPGKAADAVKSKVGDSVKSKVSDTVSDTISDKLGDAGGPGGMLKKALSGALPFGGGDDDEDDDGDGGIPGVGKGRRMPVQQSVDIGAPIETVYNHWTQFEEWPKFMHRVKRVTQEDRCTVSFQTKIWGKTKEFTAKIETQRPDERVKWRVTDGMTHTGVVTFHELGPRLTRVLLGLDVEPSGMLEKAARGLRHVKRAARGDLHRFKAFVEMQEEDTDGWRGVIEDGKVKRSRSGGQSRNGSEHSGRRRRSSSSSSGSGSGGSSNGRSSRSSSRGGS